jgi:DNA primase
VPTWIDLREFRKKLRFEQVLRYYGIEINRKGEQHQGRCPLPDHGGNRESASFSVNLERNIFQCFGCKARGNVLEFAVLMEKVSLNDGRAFRDVALKLQRELFPDDGKEKRPTGRGTEPIPSAKATSPEVLVNQPLDFELKGLDGGHPNLKSKGLSPQTIDYFGLGFCSRGVLKDRIAIPLRDASGQVVGYAGETIDESLVPTSAPRYSFPERREREGKVLEFRRSLFLYNGFRIGSPVDEIFVVEDFASVWWLNQNGFPHSVGVMSQECSPEQIELIISAVHPLGRVWVMTNQNEERLAHSMLSEISTQRFVRWMRLTGRTRPVDLSPENLRVCFAS